jgi:hypothetical protein
MVNMMFRHGLLVLYMLIVSLTTAATLHASEFSGATSIDCSGYVHSEGDADQTQGDADKATPHHHSNCHGAPAFILARDGALTLRAPLASPSFNPTKTAPDRWSSGPDLRPPIA